VNTGDIGGAAIEPSTRANREVEVTSEAPALDVPVSFSETALVPSDRPSFTIGGLQSFTFTPSAGPKTIELNLLPISEGPIHQNRPAFLARFVDDNLDGVPDDANKDGVPDLWPRVLVRKLSDGENPLLDENDLDKNGVVDAKGADYDHLNPATGTVIPADGKPDAVVLAAGFDPTELAPQLVDALGMVKPLPTPVTKLKLVLKPTALDISDPTAPQVLKSVPSGRYAITVVQLTGQTWRLPNELSPAIAPKFALPAFATQSFAITVP
jgi:hypothetical protein